MRGLKRERNPNWKGGRKISSGGYVHLLTGIHQYVFEHRKVMEDSIGKR